MNIKELKKQKALTKKIIDSRRRIKDEKNRDVTKNLLNLMKTSKEKVEDAYKEPDYDDFDNLAKAAAKKYGVDKTSLMALFNDWPLEEAPKSVSVKGEIVYAIAQDGTEYSTPLETEAEMAVWKKA